MIDASLDDTARARPKIYPAEVETFQYRQSVLLGNEQEQPSHLDRITGFKKRLHQVRPERQKSLCDFDTFHQVDTVGAEIQAFQYGAFRGGEGERMALEIIAVQPKPIGQQLGCDVMD